VKLVWLRRTELDGTTPMALVADSGEITALTLFDICSAEEEPMGSRLSAVIEGGGPRGYRGRQRSMDLIPR
jgi:hypothetical protein